MAKYIDAEKLIAEIERLDKVSKETMRSPSGVGLEFAFGISAGYADVLKIITSLQREQPSGEEYAIEIGKHTHTIRVGSQSDIDNIIRQEKQEQPGADLEGEVKKWKNKHGVVGMDDLWLKFARHFYELGLNARK